mgnify:CR=1 FL=1
MRDFTSELFRREIPRPLDPRPHGRAALVAAGPCAGPAWMSRAEGGAGPSRAGPLRIFLAELFRGEIARPLHLGHTGGPRLSRPGPAPPSTNTPPTAKSTASPPTAWRAKYPRRPRRMASERASHVGWPWRTMAPTLVGARVPRARSAPHARARLGCRTSRRVRAGGGPPGTSAPTILPPAPTWPLPFSHPHPLGPYHCPTRTHLIPTILPPAPAWPLPLSHPHPLGPYHSPTRTHVGPYHCPTRTHLAPTILPPAPTWPLPFSRPHPLGPYHCPTRTAPTWPLPFSHPHPLGPYHSPTRTHVGPYHCPARTHLVPTLALQRPGARSPRAALGAGRPLSPTPCVHPMRVPCAAKLPQKSEIFLSSKDAGGIHSCAGLRADMRRAQ